MNRRIFGGTGMSVSEYALGTLFGNEYADPDQCVRMVHTALDAGINFVDSSDLYGAGQAEEILGRALQGRRDSVVISTKFRLQSGDDPNQGGASRRWIMQAVEHSLRRLRTDWIDIYHVHRPDHATDIEETLSALTDLVRAGKVREIGTSCFRPEQIVEAQWVAERRGLARFRSEEPPYSILARGIEGTTLPLAQRYGMGVLTWGPLSSGWLANEDLTNHPRAAIEPAKFDLSAPENASKLVARAELAKLAADLGMPMSHLAIAFIRAHPAVTSVIIGPNTLDQLEDLLAGADVVLDKATLDRIDEIVPPGVDLNRADNFYHEHPALTDASLRRR